jgi:hypothetical protein
VGTTSIQTNVNVDATNSVRLIKMQFPGASIRPVGKLLVVTPKGPQDGACNLGALTSADTYLSITTFGASNPALCPFDKAVLNDLVARVNSGRLQHFSPWPANSAGRIRACSLLTMAEAVKALPPVNSTFPIPDGHSCVYDHDNGPTSVYFGTMLDAAPDTLAKLQAQWQTGKEHYPGKSVVVAGRRTLIGPSFGTTYTEDHSCIAETDGRVWPHGFGNDSAPGTPAQPAAFTEVPSIILSDASLPSSTLCQDAALLAQEVWPGLPR